MMKNYNITYTTRNGVRYPNIQISKDIKSDSQPIGKYGQMYLTYLKAEYPERYTELRISGELMPLIHKVNDETHRQVKELCDDIMKQYPSTDDTMQKYKYLNTCIANAEEIVLKDYLYQTR